MFVNVTNTVLYPLATVLSGPARSIRWFTLFLPGTVCPAGVVHAAT